MRTNYFLTSLISFSILNQSVVRQIQGPQTRTLAVRGMHSSFDSVTREERALHEIKKIKENSRIDPVIVPIETILPFELSEQDKAHQEELIHYGLHELPKLTSQSNNSVYELSQRFEYHDNEFNLTSSSHDVELNFLEDWRWLNTVTNLIIQGIPESDQLTLDLTLTHRQGAPIKPHRDPSYSAAVMCLGTYDPIRFEPLITSSQNLWIGPDKTELPQNPAFSHIAFFRADKLLHGTTAASQSDEHELDPIRLQLLFHTRIHPKTLLLEDA